MPAHLCLLTNRAWVFDARVINQAHSLCAAGFQVSIADVGRPLDWYRASVGDPAPALPDGCRVYRIADPFGFLPTRLQRVLRRQFRWWLNAGRIRQLAAIGADVYQAPDVLTARYALRVAARSGARVVYDIRDVYSAEWDPSATGGAPIERVRRRTIAQEAEVVRRADVLMTVCSGFAQFVAERYQLPPPLVIRHCRDPLPSDVRGPDVRSTLGLENGTPLLVHTGHSEWGRGFEEMARIVEALPALHLALVGQQGSYAQRAALGARVASRLHLLPAVLATQVSQFIRSADAALIYMLPVSFNMRYMLPNKLFEAIAAGLPLAVSDGEGFRPLVQRYGLGVLFDPAEPGAAVAAVQAILRDSQRYRETVRAAAGELSWQRESLAYLQAYKDLTAAH